jgi:hypothetical protein
VLGFLVEIAFVVSTRSQIFANSLGFMGLCCKDSYPFFLLNTKMCSSPACLRKKEIKGV